MIFRLRLDVCVYVCVFWILILFHLHGVNLEIFLLSVLLNNLKCIEITHAFMCGGSRHCSSPDLCFPESAWTTLYLLCLV